MILLADRREDFPHHGTEKSQQIRSICSGVPPNYRSVLFFTSVHPPFLPGRSDQTVILTGLNSLKEYPDKLRRTCYFDADTNKALTFLSNNFIIPALTIAQLYRCRWQVELFFRWIKQHLRIKAFYGTSINAVKTQVGIAISVYVLVAIIKKRLNLDLSLYTILQILGVTVVEPLPMKQVLTNFDYKSLDGESHNRLPLFEL